MVNLQILDAYILKQSLQWPFTWAKIQLGVSGNIKFTCFHFFLKKWQMPILVKYKN